jgi:polysaccharide biosynthesis transport protein
MTTASSTRAPNATSAGGSIGVGIVFRAMRRRPVTLFLILLMAGGAGAAVWTYLPLPKMTGYSVLQIKAQPEYITLPSGDARIEFNIYRQSQTALIKSRLVLNSAMSQPDVSNLPLIKNEPNAINWLEGQLKIDFNLGPEFMKVSIEGNNGDELKTIITAVTESYLKDVVNKDKAKRLARLDQLTKVYRKYEDTMQNQRKRIRALAETLATSEPVAAAVREKYIQEEIGICRRELSQLEREVLRAKSDMGYYETRVATANAIPVAKEATDAALQADAHYQKLKEAERAIQAALDALKGSLVDPAKHPRVIAKEKDLAQAQKETASYAVKIEPFLLAQIRDRMLQAERQRVADLSNRIGINETFRETLDKHMATLESKIKNFKISQVDLETVKAEIAQTEKIADRLYSEMESMKPELEATPRVSLWEDPVVVPGTEGNRRMKYSAMAGLGLLFLGCSVLTGLEFRNRRILNVKEVASGLGLRVIGTVPAMPKWALGDKGPPTRAQTEDWQALLMESVDSTRTLLLHGLEGDKPVRTIMVTSALSGEGKTSLSGHLAVSLARAGFKTLLVDADMRRPTLHRVLGVPLTPGLSDVLTLEATLDQVIRPTPAPGLSIIPGGLFHTRLPQVLAGAAWQNVKLRLEVEYDYIIVDSPPLLPVADALLMARHVDGVLLSLLHDHSRLGAVSEARDRLASVGTNILGVVINGLSSENYSNYYGYSYYGRPDTAPPTRV